MSSKPTVGGSNALGIRYVTKGPPGLRAKINEIIRSLDYLFPRPGADIIPEVTPQGSLYRLRSQQPPSATSRAVVPRAPFDLYNASVGSTLRVGVAPGAVRAARSGSQLVPTMGGVALDAPTAPTTVITGSRAFFLQVQVTFGLSGSADTFTATIQDSAFDPESPVFSPPTPDTINGTGFTANLALGAAVVDGGQITDFVYTAANVMTGPADPYTLFVDAYGATFLWTWGGG